MRLGRVPGSVARGCECARPSFLPGLSAPEILFAAKARKWLTAQRWEVVQWRAEHWAVVQWQAADRRLRCGLPSRQGRGRPRATGSRRERLSRKAPALLCAQLPGHRCAVAARARVVSTVRARSESPTPEMKWPLLLQGYLLGKRLTRFGFVPRLRSSRRRWLRRFAIILSVLSWK